MKCAAPRRGDVLSRLRSDRGEVASSLIMLTAVIAFILTAVHFSFILHGHHVVSSAAQDGLHAAQADQATEAHGTAAAHKTLGLFAGLKNGRVEVVKSAEEVVVTVEADIEGLFGGPFTHMSVRVEGPSERVTFEGDRK